MEREVIKYKVKKQKPTTHHIALNEKCLENWNELEAKAKAFDVLVDVLEINVLDGFRRVIANENDVALTKEQYEILEKAGLE